MSETRTIRTNVPAETFAAIEQYAATTGLSIAAAARFVLAAGLAMIDALAEKDADTNSAVCPPPDAVREGD
ncbi:hypothetical protein [Actinomadura opuntiae]|uniref:hypothetical protein n=1 Tax=Actinomadura sp. OS1-43 TaxID=604315 RepID=UPI00255B1E15|nr:hypothetical protein [Actinomadura sp. OS1-43]MDL4814975.1 hypothetical protein [Actinomadura sp. OS1-43]